MPVVNFDVSEDVAHRLNALQETERHQFIALAERLAYDLRPETAGKINRPPLQEVMREEAKARSQTFAALRRQWEQEPENPQEPTFDELKEGINENRRATGERRVY